MPAKTSEIELALDQYRDGERGAFERLMALVYEDLRRLAAWQLRSERTEHTLQPTALVHEAFLKLVGPEDAAPGAARWEGRRHFFALAAQVMRHILVDHARTRQREKRGGGRAAAALDEALGLSAPTAPGLLELDEALVALAGVDERKGWIVELRFFGGLTVEETAAVLGISPATVRREWTMAKAWLRRELRRGDAAD